VGLLGPGVPGQGPPHFAPHLHSATSPSPLRHSTSAYDSRQDRVVVVDDDTSLLDHGDRAPESDVHSPAPTFASFGDFTGGHSGYTSENHLEKFPDQDHETDVDNEMDVDHELEAMIS